MNIGMIMFNVIAAILIVLVIWWFFGNKLKPAVVIAELPFTIVIKDGIYQPAFIQIPANKAVGLQFIREDDNACAATVIFPQLQLSYELPRNKIVKVILPPQQPGTTLDFTCQMGMYRGKLVVS